MAAFERALAEHARVQYRRFDLARTLLAQGETMRRFKRKRLAREAIESSIEIFDELDAALWSAKARRELARISGRRTAEGLTETERRVAGLVTGGLSTKQVAAALVVSPKTVEGHLSKIYAKLDVHSRTQPIRRLQTEESGLAGPKVGGISPFSPRAPAPSFESRLLGRERRTGEGGTGTETAAETMTTAVVSR